MKYLVVGNGPIRMPSIPEGIDQVVRFNSAPSLQHLPGRTDVLVVAATSLCTLRLEDWRQPFTSAKALWLTYFPNHLGLVDLLGKYFRHAPNVDRIFLTPPPPAHFSSGHQVLRHLVEEPGSEIVITGFTFCGRVMHPWEIEKDWTADQINRGRIHSGDQAEA